MQSGTNLMVAHIGWWSVGGLSAGAGSYIDTIIEYFEDLNKEMPQ